MLTYNNDNKSYDAILQKVCKDFNTPCNVVEYYSGKPNAYVTENSDNIYVHFELIEKLSRDGLLFILFHELGHKVLGHTERFKSINPRTLPINEYCIMRTQFEYEADIFATMLMKQYKLKGSFQEFTDAFIPHKQQVLRSCTHDSPINRNRNIERILGR